MLENNKHSWCVNAFHGMSANNDGSTKMCCMIKGNFGVMDKEHDWDLNTKSLMENFDSPPAKQIRMALEHGIRHPACSLCWEEEDGGRKSKRLRDNDKYFHQIRWHDAKPFKGLAKLELNLGNTCNIKCRTCNAAISSTWMKEEYDLNQSSRVTFKEYSQTMKKFHQTYDEDSAFWDDLEKNLETIKQFDFYGGEPFLSKKMWEILRICVEKGYAKDIELHYNTNGTTWPKEIDLWKHFKEVNLSFSIDGIGERFEYMRFPAKWDEVVANMQKAREFNLVNKNMSLSWCITLSSLNIYYLPEVIEEYYKNYNDFGMYLNLVHGPQHFNVGKMPDSIKEEVISHLETIPKEYEQLWYQLPGIIGFIRNGTHNPDLWKTLGHLIVKHDGYREQDFKEIFRDFYLKVEEQDDKFLG